MKKFLIMFLIMFLVAVISLCATYFIGTGFMTNGVVYLGEYSVSEDGTEITFEAGVASSMGFIRGYKDEGGGVKPHYLKFYSAFGGLNGSWGLKANLCFRLMKLIPKSIFVVEMAATSLS